MSREAVGPAGRRRGTVSGRRATGGRRSPSVSGGGQPGGRIAVTAVTILALVVVATAPVRAQTGISAPRVTGTIEGQVWPLPADRMPLRLSDVAFASEQVGVAVGTRCAGIPVACNGVVLRTVDGGARWGRVAVLPAVVQQVRFLSPAFGWAWGPSAAYATNDAGRQWHLLSMPDTAVQPVIFVSFATPTEGWMAVGQSGCAAPGCPITLLTTADGGALWTLAATDGATNDGLGLSPPTLPFQSYVAGAYLGGGRGWLTTAGPVAHLEVTGDGGAHWDAALRVGTGENRLLATGTGAAAGWAVGTAPADACAAATCIAGSVVSAVFATDEAGMRWDYRGQLLASVVGLVPALSGGSAWALTVGGVPVSRCDGGAVCATGIAVLSPGPAPGAASGAAPGAGGVGGTAAAIPAGHWVLHALDPLNAEQAWAVASGPGPGYALVHTADGGHTWRAAFYTTRSYVPSRLMGFVNESDGWAIGAVADPVAVLRSTNDGLSWVRIGTAPTADVQSAGFVNVHAGWLLAADQTSAWTTDDGGALWQRLVLPAAPHCGAALVQAMGFESARAGWILEQSADCGQTALFTTSDGGLHWSAPVYGSGTLLTVAGGSGGPAWAVAGPDGRSGDATLQHSSDGGRVWRAVSDLGPYPSAPPGSPLPLWLQGALSVDQAGGVWLGTLRSTDGGRTWTRYALILPQGAAGAVPLWISFVGGRIGWMRAGNGLWFTADAGHNWVEVGPAGPSAAGSVAGGSVA